MAVAGGLVREVLVQNGSQILTAPRPHSSLSPYYTSANFLPISISLMKYVGTSNCLYTVTKDS
jgi:hypothetical protein